MFKNVYAPVMPPAPVMPSETSAQEKEIAQALVEFGTREVTDHERRCNKAAEVRTKRKRAFTCEEVKECHVCFDGQMKPWSKYECPPCNKGRKLYCDNKDHVTREGTFPRWRDCQHCRPEFFKKRMEKKMCEHHKAEVSHFLDHFLLRARLFDCLICVFVVSELWCVCSARIRTARAVSVAISAWSVVAATARAASVCFGISVRRAARRTL